MEELLAGFLIRSREGPDVLFVDAIIDCLNVFSWVKSGMRIKTDVEKECILIMIGIAKMMYMWCFGISRQLYRYRGP